MFGTIFYRMILLELIRVFTLSLLAIMGILVLGGMVAELSQRGLPPSQIFAVIPLLIPNMLPWTLPSTTLFATCLVYGRLAHDNEILAIKSAGINPLKVVAPAIVLGLCMSGTTMALLYRFVPHTQHMLRSQGYNNLQNYLYALLKKDKCIREPKLGYTMYVGQVQGERLRNATFLRHDKDVKGQYDLVAKAEEARIEVHKDEDQIVVRMRKGRVLTDKGDQGSFSDWKEWEIPLDPDLGVDKKFRPSAMSWRELLESRRQLHGEIDQLDRELEDPSRPAEDLKHRKHQRRDHEFKIHNLQTEFQWRPALSLGCFCFALVGCPVGIWFSRSDFLSSFISCFLPIVVIYYPMLLCGTNLSKQGKVPAALAMWAADVVIGVIALGLFRRLIKN